MEAMKNLGETDLRIMSCMFDQKTGLGLSKAKGITIEEIKEKLNDDYFTDNVVRYSIKRMLEYGYIDLGINKGRKKTYLVTQSGFDYVKFIKQPSVKIVQK